MSKRSGPASYDGFKVTPRADEHYKKTVARISQIQSQFSEAPRGTRLKDKVCVVTGVGSLKGIGWGFALVSGVLGKFVDWNWLSGWSLGDLLHLYLHGKVRYHDERLESLRNNATNDLLFQAPGIYTCWTMTEPTFLISRQLSSPSALMWK